MHTTHTDGTAAVADMARVAAERGIAEIHFSEHVRRSSTYYPDYFAEVRALAIPRMKAMAGVETKILDTEGSLDCPSGAASLCDAIIGSVHSAPPDADGAERHWSQLPPAAALEVEFNLALAIVTKSRAHILGHPMGMCITRLKQKPLDQLEQLARACRDHDKAFELNARYCVDPAAWIEIVSRAGCKVSLGSDAHALAGVGSAWARFVGKGTA